MHHILRYFTGLTFSVIACASMQAQEILPLIQTQWGQAAPYNMFCPKESLAGPNSLAGCGALAMAQVMRYLQEPSVSPKGEKYQWDLMPQRPSTPEEARAIARLVTDCGVNAFTAYGKNSSGTNPFNVLCAMKKCFGLNPYIYIIMREQYPGDEGRRLWRRLIMDELQAGRPVMMVAQKDNDVRSGHIFIIDGVRGSRVHVNFGWDGKGDGYYALDDLGGFNINQSAIIGIGKADYVPESKVVKTEHAGQLAELLPQNEWKQIRHLRVSGPLDKSDFKVLQQMAQMLTDEFNGEVPGTIEQLTRLPGVGRKTANVVLGMVFGKAAIPVDTHVFRVANRIGLANGKTPLEVEKQLIKHIPEEKRFKAHHWILLHGRYVCKAQRPDCLNCRLTNWCKHFSKK